MLDGDPVVASVDIDGTGRPALIAGGDGPTIQISDLESGDELARLEGQEKSLSSMAVDTRDPARTLVIGGGDTGVIQVWDLATGGILYTFPPEGEATYVDAVAIPSAPDAD